VGKKIRKGKWKVECVNCGTHAPIERVEETDIGYVWEWECPNCGNYDCNYEF